MPTPVKQVKGCIISRTIRRGDYHGPVRVRTDSQNLTYFRFQGGSRHSYRPRGTPGLSSVPQSYITGSCYCRGSTTTGSEETMPGQTSSGMHPRKILRSTARPLGVNVRTSSWLFLVAFLFFKRTECRTIRTCAFGIVLFISLFPPSSYLPISVYCLHRCYYSYCRFLCLAFSTCRLLCTLQLLIHPLPPSIPPFHPFFLRYICTLTQT